jgi:hypothetical protein
MFHVTLTEFSERNFNGLSVNPAQDFRLSERQQIFGITSIGTVRRLLDSISILVVEINRVLLPSFVNAHLQLAFLPFASRARILRSRGLFYFHFFLELDLPR